MESDAPIRILIVDDHALLRESLGLLLRDTPGMEVVGEAANGEDGVEAAFKLHPNIVLMDQSMPDISGATATRWILSGAPDVKVIGLSMFEDRAVLDEMRRAGAAAQVSKADPFDKLVAVIRSVAGRT